MDFQQTPSSVSLNKLSLSREMLRVFPPNQMHVLNVILCESDAAMCVWVSESRMSHHARSHRLLCTFTLFYSTFTQSFQFLWSAKFHLSFIFLVSLPILVLSPLSPFLAPCCSITPHWLSFLSKPFSHPLLRLVFFP